MDWLNRYVGKVSAKWSFHFAVIAPPVAAACFLAELSLAADWWRRGDAISATIDLVPAIFSLVLVAVLWVALPLRASCEGRKLPGRARIYVALDTFSGAWIGGCIAEFAIVSRGPHPGDQIEQIFLVGSSAVALIVNLFAVIILTREIIKRSPVQSAESLKSQEPEDPYEAVQRIQAAREKQAS